MTDENTNVDNSASQSLPDIQTTHGDETGKHIPKVGVTNLELPINITRKGHENINTVGKFSIYVNLKEGVKGISMSRINIIAHEIIKESVGMDMIPDLLKKLAERLETNNAHVKIRFTYFIKKKAPVTDYYGYIPYNCSIEGTLIDGEMRLYQTMEVVYTSLCPCSKEISDYSAHNQPSFGTLKVEVAPSKFLWLEDMARLVEDNGSSEMYSILKRADEKHVTERAYDNPVFVEDMVRKVAVSCDKLLDDVILDYTFATEHRESIHVSWATATINAGRDLK